MVTEVVHLRFTVVGGVTFKCKSNRIVQFVLLKAAEKKPKNICFVLFFSCRRRMTALWGAFIQFWSSLTGLKQMARVGVGAASTERCHQRPGVLVRLSRSLQSQLQHMFICICLKLESHASLRGGGGWPVRVLWVFGLSGAAEVQRGAQVCFAVPARLVRPL